MDKKQFILDERKKGTPDREIYNKLQSFNEPEQQSRDFISEALPVAGAVGGGIIGGILGSVIPVVGTAAGALAGSAIGGGGFEAIQQGIEKQFGQRKDFDTPQIAASAVLSMAGEGTGQIAGKVAGAGLKAAKPGIVNFVSKVSGYADNVVEAALKRTPGAVEGALKGERGLIDIIKRSNQKIQQLGIDALKETTEKIKVFSKMYPVGKKEEGMVSEAVSILNENKIGITKKFDLLFNRKNIPSNIVADSDTGTIKEAFKSFRNAVAKPTVENLDATFERLITLGKKTPSGTPTGPETKKIVGQLSNILESYAKKNYPKYYEFLKENLIKRSMIIDAKEIFGHTSNLNGKEISQIEMKLLQMYNTGKMAFREESSGLKQIGSAVKEDIVGGGAGALINTGDQMSVRATNLTTRNVAAQVLEYLPREIVKGYVKTGKMASELLDNKFINFASKLTGISAKSILQELINLSVNKKKN